jgi:AcrR family transcriptional regulator
MELEVRIKMNNKLFIRNPEESQLGKKIVSNGLILINKLGFEDFTFKKLAIEISTTEASIYRYFENKHRLLVYIINWYWSYLEYKVIFETNNIIDPELKLRTIIRLLVEEPNQESSDYISESEAYKLLVWEGSKAYLTKKVITDNKDRLFKPYKDLCARISATVKEYNAAYPFPNSIASSILELSHSQKFFMNNLPALTDSPDTDNTKLIAFLENILFSAIHQSQPK